MRLNSEPIQPVNGSTVLIPANRTGVGEEAVIRLSCTVVNQGRFTWVWTLPDSVSSTTQQEILDSQLILDGTRTSVIEVPWSRESVGDYTCTASYATGTGLPASSVAEKFIIDVECELLRIQIRTQGLAETFLRFTASYASFLQIPCVC